MLNGRWRGREISRVEGFSDAVFAFAVTLLVVPTALAQDAADWLQRAATAARWP